MRKASVITGERMAKKRVAVLISGRGSNMASLIEAAKEHSYPAEIAVSPEKDRTSVWHVS